MDVKIAIRQVLEARARYAPERSGESGSQSELARLPEALGPASSDVTRLLGLAAQPRAIPELIYWGRLSLAQARALQAIAESQCQVAAAFLLAERNHARAAEGNGPIFIAQDEVRAVLEHSQTMPAAEVKVLAERCYRLLDALAQAQREAQR